MSYIKDIIKTEESAASLVEKAREEARKIVSDAQEEARKKQGELLDTLKEDRAHNLENQEDKLKALHKSTQEKARAEADELHKISEQNKQRAVDFIIKKVTE